MKFAVVQFPGSNCDQDCLAALRGIERDRSRLCLAQGNIARRLGRDCSAGRIFLRRLFALRRDRAFLADHARGGRGSARGETRHRHLQRFSNSLRSGPAPGRARAQSLAPFCLRDCDDAGRGGRVAVPARAAGRDVASAAVAHGEGCYFADEATFARIERAAADRCCAIAMRTGRITPAANPNGSLENIAGICNREGNVFGLMPHPDRACEERLGSSDGARNF